MAGHLTLATDSLTSNSRALEIHKHAAKVYAKEVSSCKPERL